MNTITFTEALRTTLNEEMARDVTTIVMGEDIGIYGGAFGVTRGLLDTFGPHRVIDTPISEGSIVGVGVGAALTGLRPVVEIMFMDFLALAMDQLTNQAAKLRYLFGEQAACPLVLRTASGAGRCYGPTHSQTFEAWLTHVPGLKVAIPATPADAAGLLRSAIRDANPVVFLEHKLLYGQRGQVPDGHVVPFGKARTVRTGRDVTLVAWGAMVACADEAATLLEDDDIQAEVLDMRTLAPLDGEAILTSVRKTGRLVVVDEAPRTGGFSAEIAAQAAEYVLDYLEAPVRRVTGPDCPIPASPALEQAYLPTPERVADAVVELFDV